MSFLSELKKQKERLKETETVDTRTDGIRFVESSGTLVDKSFGFVVDTKPDDIPILIETHLYIGSQDCATSIVLEKYDIKQVLSLGIDVDISNVEHKYVPILDLPETDIKSALLGCLPFVRSGVERKENVLVHCNAGVSRTSMVAIAYLMHYEGMCFEDAYQLVKTKRPAIQPNAGFKKQLQCMKPHAII